MKNGVLVVGSINMDLVAVAPRIPAPGEYIHASGFHVVTGGKGANQALASHRLGSETMLLARVGDDSFGRILIEKLEAEGGSTELVVVAPGYATGVALIVVEEQTGQNTIVVDPGANRSMTALDLDAVDAQLQTAAVVLFQLEIPVDVSKEASMRARARGALTILDSGPARRADASVAPFFDVVSPNEPELEALTGKPVAGLRAASFAAQGLLIDGVKMVVVKMGGSGALLVEKEGARHFPAYDVPCLDSTGAGDAFTAGLACGLAEGMNPTDAVALANAAGAIAVTAVGTQPSMPTRARVRELMDSQNVKSSKL